MNAAEATFGGTGSLQGVSMWSFKTPTVLLLVLLQQLYGAMKARFCPGCAASDPVSCILQEQKRLELEEMNRVFAELGIETPQTQTDKKAEAAGNYCLSAIRKQFIAAVLSSILY